MDSLLEHARAYVACLNIEGLTVQLVVVDEPAFDRYAIYHDNRGRALIYIDAGTANGPDCGEIVYRAGEALRAARALAIRVRTRSPKLIPS